VRAREENEDRETQKTPALHPKLYANNQHKFKTNKKQYFKQTFFFSFFTLFGLEAVTGTEP
jgi:hypothetical protein